MNDLEWRLLAGAGELAGSAAAAGWRGPDPYDGLWWRWPEPLRGGRRRRQVLMQLHARSPLDVRRLYRRAHPLIAKTLGAFGSVGLRLHALTGDEEARATALRALRLLDGDRGAGDVAWGYPWDTQTRWSFYRAGVPNVVVTAFAASALLEAGSEDLAARARRAAAWALEELWIEPEGFFGYHPGRPANIHNANLLGAWLVHVGAGDDPAARTRVARAVERTLAHQAADGSWPYGEGAGLQFVDSFHTGYVLSCLDRLRSVDPRVGEAVARGAQRYEAFFDPAGRAQLWQHRRYPEDGHSAGTGMTALGLMVRRGLVDRELLERVARRALDAGLRDGHAVVRRYRWGPTRVRYVRWADAHMALGFVDAAAALAGREDLAPGGRAIERSARSEQAL